MTPGNLVKRLMSPAGLALLFVAPEWPAVWAWTDQTRPSDLAFLASAARACVVEVANPHVVSLEDGSRHKRADADHLGFKAEVDPMGLLNPGKMTSFRRLR
jgi:FAD/FMN-containing dehydrogenase